MSPLNRIAVLLISPLLLTGAAPRAQDRDSLTYTIVREQAVRLAVDSATVASFVETADELARQGHFRDAADLLTDLLPADTAAPPAPPAVPPVAPPPVTQPKQKSTEWDLSLSTTYNNWVDSSSTDSLVARDSSTVNSRLYLTTLSASLRWNPGIAGITAITPAAQVSESQASLGLGENGALFAKHVTYDASVRAEKWRAQVFGDSSDALRASLSLEAITDTSGSGGFSLPASVEVARYRIDRPGSTSSIDARVDPAVTMGTALGDRSTRVHWATEYERYAPVDDSLTVIRGGPGLSVDLSGEHMSLSFTVDVTAGYYPHCGSPRVERLLENDLSLSHETGGGIELILDESYSYEKDSFRDSLVYKRDVAAAMLDTALAKALASYTLNGHDLQLKPSVRIPLWERFAIEPAFGFEVTYDPVLSKLPSGQRLWDPQYLTESLYGYEPELTLSYDAEALDVSLSPRLRYENVWDNKSYFLEDSKTGSLSLDVNWRITGWLSLSMSGEFERRMTLPDHVVADSKTGSASLEARF